MKKAFGNLLRGLLLLLGLAVVALGVDFFSPDIGYFRSGLSLAQEQDVDMHDALALFDETCFTNTASRLLPIDMQPYFQHAGLNKITGQEENGFSRFYVDPLRPVYAYSYHPIYDKRQDKPSSEQLGTADLSDFAFECVLSFENYQQPNTEVAGAFENFANSRLPNPMHHNVEGITADISQEQQPWDYAAQGINLSKNIILYYDLRSFLVGDMQYVIVLAREMNTGRYLLKLMMRPIISAN